MRSRAPRKGSLVLPGCSSNVRTSGGLCGAETAAWGGARYCQIVDALQMAPYQRERHSNVDASI